jgi:hypothetical protein
MLAKCELINPTPLSKSLKIPPSGLQLQRYSEVWQQNSMEIEV